MYKWVANRYWHFSMKVIVNLFEDDVDSEYLLEKNITSSKNHFRFCYLYARLRCIWKIGYNNWLESEMLWKKIFHHFKSLWNQNKWVETPEDEMFACVRLCLCLYVNLSICTFYVINIRWVTEILFKFIENLAICFFFPFLCYITLVDSI